MRCISCMKEIEEGLQVCNYCNYPQDSPMEYPDSLTPGTELRNRFLLGKELGRGGFGITYVGYDKYFERKVAIKEYYPQTLAARMPGEAKLFWLNAKLRDSGCQNVIREAQKMHRIDTLPAAVHVLDVFEENNTAYIAMDYVDGITMKQHLLNNGVLSPEKCMEMMLPILDTMIQMHEAGIIHRDISPDNIMIQTDLKPRILDLGAAKDIEMETGNTILVARNGFSPMEQYRTNGNIGAWTDVYALCATMYYSLTGKVPPAAMDRSDAEDDLPLKDSGIVPMELFLIIQDGMRMDEKKRIQDVTELKNRLLDWQNQKSRPVIEDKPEPVLPDPKPPLIDNSPKVSEDPVEPRTNFLSGILSLFGGQKKPVVKEKHNNAERKPTKVYVANPDAFPVYTDPDATACPGNDDDEQTVLIGAGSPAYAKGMLVQNSTGKRFEINKCCFVLGRLTTAAAGNQQSTADCMIKDDTKHISRRHAVILFNGVNFYLQDISERNKTMLNDIRIQNSTMPEKGSTFTTAYPLYDGDCIQLVDEKLTFHLGGGL